MGSCTPHNQDAQREQFLDDTALVAVAIQQTTMTLKSKDEIHEAFIRVLELVPAEIRGVAQSSVPGSSQ